MSDKTGFEYSEFVSTAEVASYLQNLAAGLRNGSVEFEGCGQSIVLAPTERVKLELMAESSKDKEELHFEISWKPSYMAASESLQIFTGGQPEKGTAEEPESSKSET